jgi:hypothetical protein
MSTAGIYWYDPDGNKITLEYSADMTDSPLSWTTVSEVKAISSNPEAADEIPFTHYGSTQKERRLGLANPGSYEVTCNFAPKDATQATVIALGLSSEERFWRIRYPKAVSGSTIRAGEFFSARVSVSSRNIPGAEDSNPVDLQFTLLLTGATFVFTPES